MRGKHKNRIRSPVPRQNDQKQIDLQIQVWREPGMLRFPLSPIWRKFAALIDFFLVVLAGKRWSDAIFMFPSHGNHQIISGNASECSGITSIGFWRMWVTQVQILIFFCTKCCIHRGSSIIFVFLLYSSSLCASILGLYQLCRPCGGRMDSPFKGGG